MIEELEKLKLINDVTYKSIWELLEFIINHEPIIKSKLSALDLERVATVQETVCDYYMLPVQCLKIKSRKKDFVRARHMSMYFIKHNTKGLSLLMIARLFNRVGHETVIHACQSVEDQNSLKTGSQKYRDEFKELEEIIKAKIYPLAA